MTDSLPDERPHRRREYSGPGSTLGLAALIVLAVGVAIWYFEFRDGGSGSGTVTPGLGIVALADELNPTDKPPAANEGRAAPNFKLAALDGEPSSLDAYRGRFVLVNFWASWCGPCKAETPDLQAFYENFRDTGFVILGVNQQERQEAAQSFADEFGVTYPVLLDRSGEVSEAYRVGRGMPVSFLVSPEGVIERVYVGALKDEQFGEMEAMLP